MIMIYDIWLYDILCPLSLYKYIYMYIYTHMAASQNVKPRSIPWTHRPINTPDPYQTTGDPDRSIRLDHRGPIHTRILTQPLYIYYLFIYLYSIYIYHAFNHMHVIRLRVDITAPVFRFTLQPRILSNGSDLEHSLPETRAPPLGRLLSLVAVPWAHNPQRWCCLWWWWWWWWWCWWWWWWWWCCWWWWWWTW